MQFPASAETREPGAAVPVFASRIPAVEGRRTNSLRLRPRTAHTGQRRDAPREPWSFSAAPAGRSIGGVARPRRPHATRCGDRERSRSGVMHHYLGALSRDSARPSSHVVADRPDADLDICPSSDGQGPHLEAAYLLTSAPVLPTIQVL